MTSGVCSAVTLPVVSPSSTSTASSPSSDVTRPENSVMRLHTRPVSRHSSARRARRCVSAAIGSGATEMARRCNANDAPISATEMPSARLISGVSTVNA